MPRLKLFPISLVPILSSLPINGSTQLCLSYHTASTASKGQAPGYHHWALDHPGDKRQTHILVSFPVKQLTLVVPPAAVYVHTASHTAPLSCGGARRDTRSVSYLSSLPAPDPGLHPAM